MERTEGSVLDAIYEDDETREYDEEDVEMVDADVGGGGGGDEAPERPGVEAPEGAGGGSHQMCPTQGTGMKKKKKNKKKRRRNSGSAPNITDINR